MFSTKLSQQEINKALGKIREKYKEYSDKFFKPAAIARSFEARYAEALNRRVDMGSFLSAEISVISELLMKEEQKLQAAGPKKAAAAAEKKGFADKIIEQNQKKIEKYKDILVTEGAGAEIGKIAGVFSEFEQNFWPVLETIIRKSYSSYTVANRLQIENRLLEFCPARQGGFPRAMNRYGALVKEFPRRHNLIEKEEKNLIIQAAAVIHDLVDEIASLKQIQQDEKTLKTLEEINQWIQSIISDFRLKDLKPNK